MEQKQLSSAEQTKVYKAPENNFGKNDHEEKKESEMNSIHICKI